jgi:phospholipase C
MPAAGAAATEPTATGPIAGAVDPCVGAPPPSRWQHVIWIWFENKPSTAVIGSSSAPYLNQLTRSCELATDYHGVAHPSLPNYIAATSGSTHGIADDAAPDQHPIAGPSLFGQVGSSGGQWRSYQESMPSACALQPQGTYAVKHNPAAYYTDIRTQCGRSDVSLGALTADLRADALPTFAFVAPNLCSDMHDCPVATGDAWLRSVLPTILESPSYQDGTTAIFLTWDEDDSAHGNLVPLIAIAPSVRPGAITGVRTDHYSLLRTTEDMLGLPPLGAAATATPVPGF